MTVIIKNTTTRTEIKQLLDEKRKAKKTLSSFVGKLKRNTDGLTYQKEKRDEWS